jgi:dTDP-4-dehydrorhamnose reductase
LLNAGAVLHISYFASRLNIPFHYLSTELVFNGEKSLAPYTEKDAPDPLLVNGKTKQLGELATLSASKNNSVIRLIMCYSPIFEKKGDLARLVVKKLSANESFSATDDQLVNPIYVFHLVDAISKILEKRASGIFHVGATTYTTPYKFAKLVAKTLKLNYSLIKPVKFKDFIKTRPEPRPKNQWLDTKKFVKTFGKGILKPVEEGIEDFAKDYKRLNK